MFYHSIDPVLFRIGPLEVRYYGIIYVLGFIIAYFMIQHLARKREMGLSKDDLSDLIFYELIGVVIGARLFYVVFYNMVYYLQKPLEVFAVWHGGLSFHGGLAGAIVAAYWFSRKKKFDLLALADIVVIPAALALALGRIGNFLNGELVGRITTVPWAVQFQGYEGFRHPSQLYESAKNFIIFGVLWYLKEKKLPKGMLFWTFTLLYSVLRFFIEFVREPDSQLGFIVFNLTMGQLLNVAMLIVALFFIFNLYKKSAKIQTA
ncbi:prolipoprotein diacylglyceryl transferase [Candidatus Woesearchaeota archaeon]|nr:prolipoprotein diacylglyceryl transferase [Candidatus Woesearchaeota archaeon]